MRQRPANPLAKPGTLAINCEGSGAALPVHANQIYACKKQLQNQADRAFDAGAGRDGEAAHALEIEKVHAKIGQLTIK